MHFPFSHRAQARSSFSAKVNTGGLPTARCRTRQGPHAQASDSRGMETRERSEVATYPSMLYKEHQKHDRVPEQGYAMEIRKQDVLDYHRLGRKGKIEVVPSKPCRTQYDLSLAYTPGVAEPCLDIQEKPELAFEYTARGNLVAVISNGTAVLGLGNIGALSGK